MDSKKIALALRALADAFESEPTVPAPAELLKLADAARIAATTIAILRKAIRTGALEAFGKQRDRSVRRVDLERWIASRRVVVDGRDDASIERRVEQLARARAARKRKERAA